MNVSPRFRSRACQILQPAGSSPTETIAAAGRRPSPSATVCCAEMREALPRDAKREGMRAAPHTRGDVPYCKCAVLRRACGKELAARAPAQGLRWCQHVTQCACCSHHSQSLTVTDCLMFPYCSGVRLHDDGAARPRMPAQMYSTAAVKHAVRSHGMSRTHRGLTYCKCWR